MTAIDGPDLRLPDPLRSRAVLIGPREYRHLSPLASVANNVNRLRELLTDDEVWGLPDEHCIALTEPETTDEVEEALLTAGREAKDTLLFYFAGHGLLEYPSARLYLALGAAEKDPIHRAIDYDRIRRAIRESPCPSKVVILDCCYSGNAAMSGPNEVADLTGVEGTYLLTACDENRLAVAPPDAEFTAFTGALLRVLEGIPDGPELLIANSVYWRLRAELLAKGFPLPMQRGTLNGNHIVLARNRATARRATQPSPAPTETAPAIPDWRPPAAVLERLAQLDEAGARPAAESLLAGIGASRVPQEVLGMVTALDTAGAAGDADRVLAAFARRTAGDVAALIRILLMLNRPAVLRRLRQAVAERDSDGVVAIAGRLPADQRDALLDVAMDVRFGRPDDLTALVATLSTVPAMNQVLDTLLERTAARIPPVDAASLGDVLREAGRESAAFRFYEAAEEVLGQRAATEVAAVAAAMHAAGDGEQARRLIARAADRCATVGDFVDLLTAVWPVVLPGAADTAVAAAARQLPEDQLLLLAAELWWRARDEEAGDLLSAAVADRPSADPAAFLRALVEAGRPVDVRRVVQAAARRSADDVVRLAGILETAAVEPVYVLADAVLALGPARTAEVLSGALRIEQAALTTHLIGRLRTAPAGELLEVLLEMVRRDQRPHARWLAEACVESLRGPWDRTPPAQKTEWICLIIDLAIASPALGGRLTELAAAELAGQLMAEPAVIVVTVLARLNSTPSVAHENAILDVLAGRGPLHGWAARLTDVSADLAERFLERYISRRSGHQIVQTLQHLGGLDAPGAATTADRIVEILGEHPCWNVHRLRIGEALITAGIDAWTVDLIGYEPAAGFDVISAAVFAELRELLAPGRRAAGIPAPRPADHWAEHFSVIEAEMPYCMMDVGGADDGCVLGFTSDNLHCRGHPGELGSGLSQRFCIRYRQLVNVSFVPMPDRGIGICRYPAGSDWIEPPRFWPVGSDRTAVAAVAKLLDRLAEAARTAEATTLDRPLGFPPPLG